MDNHSVSDAWSVRRQTYGYLRRLRQYQFILLNNRGTCVCVCVCVCEQIAQNCTGKRGGRKSNSRLVVVECCQSIPLPLTSLYAAEPHRVFGEAAIFCRCRFWHVCRRLTTVVIMQFTDTGTHIPCIMCRPSYCPDAFNEQTRNQTGSRGVPGPPPQHNGA